MLLMPTISLCLNIYFKYKYYVLPMGEFQVKYAKMSSTVFVNNKLMNFQTCRKYFWEHKTDDIKIERYADISLAWASSGHPLLCSVGHLESGTVVGRNGHRSLSHPSTFFRRSEQHIWRGGHGTAYRGC